MSSKSVSRYSPPITQYCFCMPASFSDQTNQAFTSPTWPRSQGCPFVELRRLGRARHGGRRGLAARDRERDRVEITRADLALVAHRREALGLCRKFALLH